MLPSAQTGIVFALYKDQTDRVAIWQETQSVAVDAAGHYAVLLGAGTPEGIPGDVFGNGEARWLGVTAEGQAEQPRVLLTSVPYAMKAWDAETLGGLPASAFLRAGTSGTSMATASASGMSSGRAAKANSTTIGASGAKVGYLPAFVDTNGDLGSSMVSETSKGVSVGTALSVAGVVQSSTGGFKFPDGTTQTTALKLPATWKLAARTGAVATATNTSNGPAAGPSTSLAALPAGIEGISSGSGITVGVLGAVTSTSASAFGLGVMGTVAPGSHGSAVMAYSNDGNDPVVEAVDTSTSGKHTLYSGDAYSAAFNGLGINFHTPTVTGTIINASANDTLLFQVGGGGDIWSNGGLTVAGPAKLNNGLTVNGNLTVTGKINGSSNLFKNDEPMLTAPGAKLGYLPVFTDASGDLGDSLIFQNTKGVGIGTAAPANPLSVAGVIQSTTGGFKFPDGTTQTTAVTLPVNWKSTAAAGSSVLSVTNSTNGPAFSQSATTLPALPHSIVGTASGHGTTVGVMGQATGTANSDIGIGVLGQASQGVSILGYNNTSPYPTIVAWNGPGSANSNGAANAIEGDLYNPAGNGLVIKFNVAPTTGNLIEAGIPHSPGGGLGGGTEFRVDGNSNVSTSGKISAGGGLSVQGATTLNGGISNGLKVSGDVSVSNDLRVTGTTSLSGGVVGGLTVNNGMTIKNIEVPGNVALEVTSGVKVDGDLWVGGNIQKSSGTFKIDHPLDPANKYLYHSFVESPDMMNIYNGNVVTDARGMAIVELPSYFEALNQDFRYQLTVIGQFAQAIVATEIANNRFTIQTDKPAVKVSWQVTGIRHDAYADAHRVVVEEEKPEKERGTYLHPELFGAQPENAESK